MSLNQRSILNTTYTILYYNVLKTSYYSIATCDLKKTKIQILLREIQRDQQKYQFAITLFPFSNAMHEHNYHFSFVFSIIWLLFFLFSCWHLYLGLYLDMIQIFNCLGYIPFTTAKLTRDWRLIALISYLLKALNALGGYETDAALGFGQLSCGEWNTHLVCKYIFIFFCQGTITVQLHYC